jgi:nucleoside 2-deoxyribosyltransferase
MNLNVYLAGGMTTSDWQSIVMHRVSKEGFTFFNPRHHKLDDSKEYSNWDLFYVSKCDVLFAFMQDTNPSGIGLSLEVGYARALNKLIILIDEKSITDSNFKKYFSLVRETSSIVFENLDDGINYLLKLKNGVTTL